MKTQHVYTGFVVLAALICSVAPADTPPSALRAAVDRAISKVKPALVQIHVVETYYREGRENKYEISGSGVVITPEGHVITNHHVAGHAARIKCIFSDKTEMDADLVGKDPLTDLAIIKLRPAAPREFPTVAFGDSSAVQVGDQVLAMGSPRALSQSVTLGIISNTEMIMPDSVRRWGGMEMDGEDVGALVRWLGHDAAIYPGNSGGPLVNLDGEIIGINEIGMGLGGAIPGNLAKEVAAKLIAEGKVVRAWLGLDAQPRLKGSGHDRGVLVSGVLKDSPATSAGLQAGDLLVSLNGVAIDVRFAEQLPDFNQLVADLPIGQPVVARVLRGGSELDINITPIEREPMLPDQVELKPWGLTVRDLSIGISKELKRDTTDGVLVTSVRPGGPAGASKPQIQRNDVIVSVGGEPIKNVSDLVALTEKVTEGASGPTPTLTNFERKNGQYLTVIEVGITELQDPGLEVKKAWLPVEAQVITRDIARLLGGDDLKGFRVTHVYNDSTAESAGLLVGDLILAVDDQPLTASALEHYEELPTLIRQYRSGDTISLRVRRGGEQLSLPVELVLAPKLDREMKKYRNEAFEFTVRDITFFDKAQESWRTDQVGVLVDEVKSGGWAALGQLSVGDLLLSIDGQPAADVEAVRAVLEAVEEAKPDTVVFKVLRGIHTLFIEIEPQWNPAS
ncbi:MAG: PDZ domain-containing protein [Candidatus Hydrogenedentes bacterium]|nr:PDZ domain-containing protein [Candidatus Hydrogenedentota bacterium]